MTTETASELVDRAKIEAIRACVAKSQNLSSERISNGIAQVEAISVDAETWAEFAEEAAQAKSMTLAAMLNLRDSAKAREEEAARVEAQRLENERIAAEQRAASEAIAAQQRALAEQAAALAAQQKAIDDAKAEAARKEREAEEAEARNRQAQINAQMRTLDAAEDAAIVAAPAPAPAVVAATPRPIHPAAAALRNEPPTLKLGTICDRLGFTVSAAFMAELGFDAHMEKRACMYRESEWPAIFHQARLLEERQATVLRRPLCNHKGLSHEPHG